MWCVYVNSLFMTNYLLHTHIGVEGATAIVVFLPPGTAENVHFKKIESKAAVKVVVSQFVSISQGGLGEVSLCVYVCLRVSIP